MQKDSTKIAFTYGLEALDMLDIMDRKIANQKAITNTIGLKLELKDSEIDGLRLSLNKMIKQYYDQQKAYKKKGFWQWIKDVGAGVVLGFLISVSTSN